jgi:UDPglucose 6-dehydrogenase
VTTGEKLRQVLIRHGCDPTGFDVASNPEFLREGTAVTDFLFPDRIVIGTDSTRAAKLLRQAYAPLTTGAYAAAKDALPAPDGARVPARLIETSAKSAELIKHASNSFLAMKVSFINAVANLCEAVGADVGEVCEGIGADSRIGDKFLRPGIGYGGSCFPKDLLAFRAVAKSCGVDFRLLSEVMYINEQQRERFIQRVREELWVLRGKRLGVLGLAFKGGTDDLRESPAIEIVRALLKEGCELNVYDPAAMANAEKLFTSADVRFAADAYDCATDADALLILTDWDEFAELDLAHVRSVMRLPIVIDGRNLYAPTRMAKHGFHYLSVGRCEMEPQTSGISNRTNATQSSRPRRGFVDPRAA